jgi:sensor histidine kinase YesM
MKQDIELRNSKLLQFIVDDRYRLLRHAVLLFAMMALLFYSKWQEEYTGPYRYYRLLSLYAILISMCYINIFLLVPFFFFKGRYLVYLTLLSLTVILGQELIDTLMHTYKNPTFAFPSRGQTSIMVEGRTYDGFVILMSVILMTTMIKLFQRWTRDNGRIAELKTIALTMELNELKNQINPHFLFNMLNGIKALIRTDPKKATLVIMKLSEFLRYQIYENNDEKTALKAELTFLSNFLSLEMIRRDNLSIEINIPEEKQVLNGIYIPPNLFTTFVENAVKHSIDISEGEAFIRIDLSLAKDRLSFSCTNSKDPAFIPADQGNSGLGLANIKRRLNLLYNDTYTLDVLSTTNQFSITLALPL